MHSAIQVPDVLPNNIRTIREQRQLSVKDVANALKIDRNFLSAVEMGEKNFSGKTTIKTLKFYNTSFNMMFDIKQNLLLPVTYQSTETTRNVTICVTVREELLADKDKAYKAIVCDDKIMRKIILDNLEESNTDISIFTLIKYKVLSGQFVNNVLEIELELDGLESLREYKDFDINFSRDENTELANKLARLGYPDTIATIEKEIDGENIILIDDKIKLDQIYKIPYGNDLSNYFQTDVLSLSSVEIKQVDPKGVQVVRFKAIRPEINNLRYLRNEYPNLLEDMPASLGLTPNGYLNLEMGHQKVSTKVFWRLVNKLHLPLELIINIDEYYERFCKHSKKIEKTKRKFAAQLSEDLSDETEE